MTLPTRIEDPAAAAAAADSNSDNSKCPSFSVTGSAAHGRFVPLVPRHWIDTSPYASATKTSTTSTVPDLLWENAPRHETKAYRDVVRCYSHLPNGTDILDSKWVLARLLGQQPNHHHHHDAPSSSSSSFVITLQQQDQVDNPADNSSSTAVLATLEAHCFRGMQGFVEFCQEKGLWKTNHDDENAGIHATLSSPDIPDLSDLAKQNVGNNKTSSSLHAPTSKKEASAPPPNWWVVKDASSNGAGGIWVVGPGASATALGTAATSPLLPNHKYVAQRYAWPCVLYQGRKTHIRVYGLITADGRAFVHRRCFLHVANDAFFVDTTNTTTSTQSSSTTFVDSVHITNCCANSHDADKFAGEICATLFDQEDDTTTNHLETINNKNNDREQQDDIDLSQFFPSIQASIAALADRTLPFLQGGTANHGFEYLGLDFILSYSSETGQPLAYLLEVNAPPSQDTATGLPHAEDLHNDVLRDLLTLWVVPKIEPNISSVPGGWRKVYQHKDYPLGENDKTVPSKAATLNRMRWAIFEQKATKREKAQRRSTKRPVLAAAAAAAAATKSLPTVSRSQFDYFAKQQQEQPPLIFWENAGGTQVPRPVVQRMTTAIQHRHRTVVGTQLKQQARQAMATLLGAVDYQVCLGSNATSLLANLAHLYREQQGLLSADHEIVVCTENHWAHVQPWIKLATATGARLVWWNLQDQAANDVLTKQTRIVALTHASNVLGQVRDLRRLVQRVRQRAPLADIVVDGVAAAPHVYANLQASDVDAYVVSCHKLFGPHLGVLCAKNNMLQKFCTDDKDCPHGLFEAGTMNYEACAGVQGVLDYFLALSDISQNNPSEKNGIDDGACRIQNAYAAIGVHESLLSQALLQGLRRSPKVRVLSLSDRDAAETRLPIVSFVQESIPCAELVDLCSQQGIICRHSTFLSSHVFLDQHPYFANGFVRFSLVHYNTVDEIRRVLQFLETIPNWG